MALKKSVAALVLAILSGSAVAEWTQVGRTSSVTAYADFSTIRKKGHTAKMWSLYDFAAPFKLDPETSSASSAKGLTEYDCKDERDRTVFYAYFSDQMGRGNAVFTKNEVMDWQPTIPQSFGRALWEIACGKS
jgi:hypothetical protein